MKKMIFFIIILVVMGLSACNKEIIDEPKTNGTSNNINNELNDANKETEVNMTSNELKEDLSSDLNELNNIEQIEITDEEKELQNGENVLDQITE